MYYVIINDNICFVHNHIGMNKLLRKILLTYMAIRGIPERLIDKTGLAVCAQRPRTLSIYRGILRKPRWPPQQFEDKHCNHYRILIATSK